MRITFPKVQFNSPKSRIIKKRNSFSSFAFNLINFEGHRCSEKGFKIKEIKNLHCPVCGLVMLDSEQRRTFINDVADKTGKELIETLDKYNDETVLVGDDEKNEHKTIYRPVKQKVIEIIKETAKNNPKLNLLDIVKLKAKEFLAPLIKEQLRITAELEEYLSNIELPDNERKKLEETIQEFKKQITGESETEFKRKNYIFALNNIVSNQDIQAQIDNIAQKLPRSDNDVYSFFVKYSKEARSSREVASKFVEQSAATAEHVKPKSKNGKNNTDNFICDCAECNSLRSDKDFSVWLRQKPEIAKGIQKYLEDIQRVIDDGLLPSQYDGYIEEIVATMEKLSYGRLKLRIPKSRNDDKTNAMFTKRRSELEEINRKMGELHTRRKELRFLLNSLEQHPQFHNLIQLQLVKNQIENTERRLTDSKNTYQELEKERKEVLETLTQITQLELRLNKGDESLRSKIQELNGNLNRSRLKELEEKIPPVEANISNLERNLAKLKRKEEALNKLITPTEEIDKQIKEESLKKNELDELYSKINALEKETEDEDILRQFLNDADSEILELEKQNKEIKQRAFEKGIDITENKSRWEEYQAKIRLFETGDEIAEYSSGKSVRMPHLTTKFIETAQEFLRDGAIELFEEDEVRYFANLDRIQTVNQEKGIVYERLEAINYINNQIENLQAQVIYVLNKRTYQDILKNLNSLVESKKAIENIQRISEFRKELEIIEDTISYNDEILKQLRNYRNLKPEEFKQLINMIFY